MLLIVLVVEVKTLHQLSRWRLFWYPVIEPSRQQRSDTAVEYKRIGVGVANAPVDTNGYSNKVWSIFHKAQVECVQQHQ